MGNRPFLSRILPAHILPAALVCLIVLCTSFPARANLKIAAFDSIIPAYHRFVAARGGDPLTITDFSSDSMSRVLAEMVLIEQALALGGMDETVEFVPVPNPARGAYMLETGKVAALGYSIWDTEITGSMFRSDPVIKPGELQKVLVGRRNDDRLRRIVSTGNLHGLTAVSDNVWHEDIRILKSMGAEHITTLSRFDLQIACIKNDRGDVALLEYSGPATDRWLATHELAVVYGVTVTMPGSRHFAVSRAHPQGAAIFRALQTGLALMRENGTLDAIYRKAGLHSDILRQWKSIYPAP